MSINKKENRKLTRPEKESMRLHLALAAMTNNIPAIEELAKEVGHVDIKDEWGNTPLMFAVMQGNQEATQILIKHGADPFQQSESISGCALSLAADLNFKDIGIHMASNCSPDKKHKVHPKATCSEFCKVGLISSGLCKHAPTKHTACS